MPYNANPSKIFQTTSSTSSVDCFRYQVVAEGGAIVNNIVVFNTSSENETLQIYLKDSGDANLTAQVYEQLEEVVLAPKQRFTIKGPIVLNTEDSLGFKSTSMDTVNIFGFGAELYAP